MSRPNLEFLNYRYPYQWLQAITNSIQQSEQIECEEMGCQLRQRSRENDVNARFDERRSFAFCLRGFAIFYTVDVQK